MNKVQSKSTAQQFSTPTAEGFKFDGNTKIQEVEPIPNTPFNAIRIQDFWFVEWAQCTLTPPLESYEKCIEFLKTDMWSIIAVFVHALAARMKEQEEFNNQ